MNDEKQQEQFVGISEGAVAPYLAKPKPTRHYRQGGNPVSAFEQWTFDRAAIAQPDKGRRMKQRDYLETGVLPVIDQGQHFIGGYTDDEHMAYEGELPVVLFGDHTRAVKYVERPFVVGADGIKIFYPAIGVFPKYLYYWMKSVRLPDRGYGRHYQFLRQLSVPVPHIDEQRHIVAELETQLTRLDASVTALKRVQANLKRYRASVLKAACEGRLVPTEAELSKCESRSYESGFGVLERVRKARLVELGTKNKSKALQEPNPSELPMLPKGWAWARLDTLAVLKGGITVDKKRRDASSRLVPYLRVANVQRGYLDLFEVKEIEAPDADIKELRLMKGDILFNEGGDRDKLGRGWIWEGQLDDCIHQNHVFRARLYLNDLPSKLISWWGNSFGRAYFQREGKQTTNLASINLGKLSAFPIPIPPLAEQHRIVAEVERRLSVIEGLEATVAANLKRAERLRASVLARAFAD